MTIDLAQPWEIPGIHEPYLACTRACAAICLDHHNHPQPAPLQIGGEFSRNIGLTWPASTQVHKDTYGEATSTAVIDMGAECIAIRVTMHCLGKTKLKIAASGTGVTGSGTGVDYYLGDASSGEAFQGLVRIEISGILQNEQRRFRPRLRKKLAWMARSDSMGPGYAAIVMFGPPSTNLTKRI